MRRARVLPVGLLLALLFAGAARAHILADGVIVRQGGNVLVHVWQGQVTGLLQVPYHASSPQWDVSFLAPDSTEFTPPGVGVELRSLMEAPLTATYEDIGTWSFGLYGNQAGAVAAIRLRIWNVDHYDYTSPGVPYIVSNPTAAPLASAEKPQLWVSPNPLHPTSRVFFSRAVSGPVRLELFDVAGRRLDLLYADAVDAGPLPYDLSQRRLAAGVYFLRLQTAYGGVQTKLLVSP
jgi:hypothetical protein